MKKVSRENQTDLICVIDLSTVKQHRRMTAEDWENANSVAFFIFVFRVLTYFNFPQCFFEPNHEKSQI